MKFKVQWHLKHNDVNYAPGNEVEFDENRKWVKNLVKQGVIKPLKKAIKKEEKK
jgi:hypothetical protein